MNGKRTEVRHQSLPKVSFEDYSAVISCLNIDNNHWKFLYLHAKTSQIFVLDSAGHDEKLDSEQAASRFREYFKMRRACHDRSDWVVRKSKGGEITYSIQKDSFSCGVLLMQMAEVVLEKLPNIPQDMKT